MYREIVIQPEHDASFAWRAPPQLPPNIVPGVGSTDDDGRPVRVFMAATERACWRLAFEASEWRDLRCFKAKLHTHGCAPHAWDIVCPGRTEPARMFIVSIPCELMTPKHSTNRQEKRRAF